MIKHVFLDLDNTIFDFNKAEAIALQKVLKERNLPAEDWVIRRYSELNRQQWELLELGVITRREVKLRRFRFLFRELGVDCPAEEAAAAYETNLACGHYYIEGAEDLLDALKGKYHLYLASNGTAAVQAGRLASAGISDCFDRIFISEKIGADKPSRAFFDACFSQIPRFNPREAVIVGDSLTSDIKGGLQAGIRTVWFHPGELPNTTDIFPDYEIRRLSELPELLLKISGSELPDLENRE